MLRFHSLFPFITAFVLPIVASNQHGSQNHSSSLKSPQISSNLLNANLSDFCRNFVDLCMTACINQHHPHGFSKRTPVSYKCDTRGLDYYGELCALLSRSQKL
jgi:hypothetical protein